MNMKWKVIPAPRMTAESVRSFAERAVKQWQRRNVRTMDAIVSDEGRLVFDGDAFKGPYGYLQLNTKTLDVDDVLVDLLYYVANGELRDGPLKVLGLDKVLRNQSMKLYAGDARLIVNTNKKVVPFVVIGVPERGSEGRKVYCVSKYSVDGEGAIEITPPSTWKTSVKKIELVIIMQVPGIIRFSVRGEFHNEKRRYSISLNLKSLERVEEELNFFMNASWKDIVEHVFPWASPESVTNLRIISGTSDGDEKYSGNVYIRSDTKEGIIEITILHDKKVMMKKVPFIEGLYDLTVPWDCRNDVLNTWSIKDLPKCVKKQAVFRSPVLCGMDNYRVHGVDFINAWTTSTLAVGYEFGPFIVVIEKGEDEYKGYVLSCRKDTGLYDCISTGYDKVVMLLMFAKTPEEAESMIAMF